MTNTALLSYEPASAPHRPADVEIVVPVYNEETDLEPSVRRLHEYLSSKFPLTWAVTIADNASTDNTWGIACRLATDLPGVRAVHLDRKGRGRALRTVWTESRSPVVAYMDVDLSTDLDALLPLVAPLVSGHSDLAIGSRLLPTSRVARGPKRELISRSYNAILRAALHNRFSDAQCGFKAFRTSALRQLLPLVEDDSWFFDTELLVLAERNGFRISEIPVDWVDDPDSRVDIVSTARDDLRGLWRLRRRLSRGDGLVPLRLLRTGATGGTHGSRPSHLVRDVAMVAVFAMLLLALAGTFGTPVSVTAIVTLSAVAAALVVRRTDETVRQVMAARATARVSARRPEVR